MILPKESRNTIHNTILGIIATIMLIISLDVLIDMRNDKFPEYDPPEIIADGEIQLKYQRDGQGYFMINNERHSVNELTYNNWAVGNTVVLETSYRNATNLSIFKGFIGMITGIFLFIFGVVGLVTGLECYSRWLETGYWTKKGYRNGNH